MFFYSPSYLQMPATQQMADGDTWIVERPFFFQRPNGQKILVPPSGMGSVAEMLRKPKWTTDYGSIPRLLQAIYKRDGRNGPAYVTHDWLFKSKIYSRAEADAILLEMLIALGAGALERNTIYAGVRGGGWWAWSKHSDEDARAARDYLARFQARLTNNPGGYRKLWEQFQGVPA